MWRQGLYYSILYVETGTLLFYFVCGDRDFIILFCMWRQGLYYSSFVCGDRDFIILFCMWTQGLYYTILYVETNFIILFCSLGGSISRNSGTLKCWNEVHQYCSVSNQTSCTPFMNMHWPHQGTCRYGL
jgi:hypothetical protein